MLFVNLLIGLREGLEAALIVSIVIATLVRNNRRDLIPRVWLGVALAVAGTVVLGAILTFGPYGLSFQAQEIIGGVLSIVAVGFITWLLLWMSAAAKSLKRTVERKVEAAVEIGGMALVFMAALAVLREGLETTLFVWATVDAAGGVGQATLASVAGILIAAGIGWLIFKGIIAINLGKFFAWTALALVIVAAGVLTYGIGDLQEAGVIPVGAPAYSLEHIIPIASVAGTVLSGLINYSSEPSWFQVIAWWLYVLVMVPPVIRATGMRAVAPAPAPAPAPQETV